VSALRHGAGQMSPLKTDVELQLPAELWRNGPGYLYQRQATLLHAMLQAPWAEEELRRLCCLPVFSCPLHPECLAAATADQVKYIPKPYPTQSLIQPRRWPGGL